jgi:hypothetical protein
VKILLLVCVLVILAAGTGIVTAVENDAGRYTPQLIVEQGSTKYDPTEGVMTFHLGLCYHDDSMNDEEDAYFEDTAETPYKLGGSGISFNDIPVQIITYYGDHWTDPVVTNVVLPSVDDDTMVIVRTNVSRQAKSFYVYVGGGGRIQAHNYTINTSLTSISVKPHGLQLDSWDYLPAVSPGQHLERQAAEDNPYAYHYGYNYSDWWTDYPTVVVNNQAA